MQGKGTTVAYSRRGSNDLSRYGKEKRSVAVLIAGQFAGTIAEHADRLRSFRYDEDYDGADLSLAMQRGAAEVFLDNEITPWIDGLLPNNDLIRKDMAARAGTDRGDLLGLLAEFGKDLPGAVQIVPMADVDETMRQSGSYEAISADEIGKRLAETLDNASPTWLADEEHWSLGGAQGKIALARFDGAWYSCRGSVASTHIVKPGVYDLRNSVLNEYLCLDIARRCGLAAASASLESFGGIDALVVERYDRKRVGLRAVARLHQEDLCQALSYLSEDKYDVSANEIIAHLSCDGTGAAVHAFAEGLFFNYLMGATDAHAKNYSVLHFPGHAFELAPLYDIASILPYRKQRPAPRRAAMTIGRENRFGYITSSSIARFAGNNGLSRRYAQELFESIAEKILACLPDAIEHAASAHEAQQFSASFERTVRANCESALDNMTRTGATRNIAYMKTIESGRIERSLSRFSGEHPEPKRGREDR